MSTACIAVFVGGPLDGQTRQMPDLYPEFNAPGRPRKSSSWWADGDPDEIATVPRHVYRRDTFVGVLHFKGGDVENRATYRYVGLK